ncbi:D-alanyl-D-alanine carboxypeptidase family protein [Niveibacterium microcysteis]|uniref:serine-type D-Ala-D-Ala carboxypeptidase n=1 Tax=Niveibacterium microcysteis TaxID=2811415 RepID=A0ABX7M3Z9_9RHOO|nr:D-alanyl-D-alanine carboxypeptidase family protein [Niveibacterium microcysteis]QSI76482.1 D-alanyl-D-alanine carboxypeptidase [Niveibacterium microcysteis]
MTRLFAVLISLSLALAAPFAQANEPTPPALAARAWLLYDVGSGQVLTAQGADERIEPASLTKLMTAYVTFSALKAKTISMDQQVAVSENARKSSLDGSRMFIMPGMPVTVRELIQGMIVQSGNDACIALAELISGSEEAFVSRMNKEAQRLGLKNTQFRNAAGLTMDGHYMSPRDLATLAAAIIRDFPEYFSFYSQKEFTYNKIKQPNRNRLLFIDPTVDGMKTGHTEAAGYCLVSTAKRGSRRLISVVTGTTSDSVRTAESQKLLNYGFLSWETTKLYAANAAVQTLPVWQGKADSVKAGFTNDLVLSVPQGDAAKLKVQLESRQPLKAPIVKGAQLGTLTVTLDGKPLGTYPVVALEAVDQAGFFGRLWDAIRYWIKNL